PHMFRAAGVVLLNKIDLLTATPFDRARFLADIREANPALSVIEVSATRGEGLDRWYAWLRARLTALSERRGTAGSRRGGGSGGAGGPSGDHGLTEADTAVVRRDVTVPQHAEAVGLESLDTALHEERVLENAARQRDGAESGALASLATAGHDRVDDAVVES